MRYVVLALLLLLPGSLPSAAPATTGTVKGKVIVTRGGKVAPREFVYVYLVPVHTTGRKKPTPVAKEIVQNDQNFHPRVQVIPLRSKVDFPNKEKPGSTKNDHNVFSPSPPGFDLQTYPPGKSKAKTFDRVDEYKIYCDVHSNMAARVKVVNTEYIARVAVDGSFTLKDVDPDDYKLYVWTPNNDEVTEAVTVTAGQTTTIAHPIQLPLKPDTGARHPRKDGTSYLPCKYAGKPCTWMDEVW